MNSMMKKKGQHFFKASFQQFKRKHLIYTYKTVYAENYTKKPTTKNELPFTNQKKRIN